ncbi:MAG: hypothetical protein H6551_02445 [Chitinophagales bacterium]|nr:hypothetical protein [Chitinophagaceae bacterium]MCB9063981.1 hypothetical protein [Chitinophagales bacterium]
MRRKTLKILCIVLAVLSGLEGFAYVNSLVSYRYEVKDGRFNLEFDADKYTEEQLAFYYSQIDQREKVILRDIKMSSYLFWIFLLMSILIAYVLTFTKSKVLKT